MVNRDSLRDVTREREINRARLIFVSCFLSILSVILIYRYYSLQIIQHEAFLTQSDRNRIRVQVIPPTRGQIYDRKGRPLAVNSSTFVVGIVSERATDINALVVKLTSRLSLTDQDLRSFWDRYALRGTFEFIPLKFGLDEKQLATIAVDLHTLPGVAIEAQLIREYPHREILSHALGYVGRISGEDLEILDKGRYRGTLHTGKVGLEKRYEAELQGDPGFQHVEADAHGRVLRILKRQPPQRGLDLRLHLDLDLQLVASEAFSGHRGAVVVMDPATGGVLAMVSNPNFDPNLFVNGISIDEYAKLRESEQSPLLNRVVQGQYPPGSTIKPFLGLAGLHQKFITPDSVVPDPGWYSIPGDDRRYRDWTLKIRGSGHADFVDLGLAIAESCDTYFYDLAYRMGIEKMAEVLFPFGLGRVTGIDTTGEQPGILPNSAWKQAALGEAWYPGETISAGIGQGYMLTTPIQLAQATLIMANRGVSFVPSMVQSINYRRVGIAERELVSFPKEYWQIIIESMVDVVHSARGTASFIGSGLNYEMAGKTGTSQVIGIAQDSIYEENEISERNRNHGLFVAFAPSDHPRIVVVVLSENGGSSRVASPVALKIIDAWLEELNDV